jgi:hypothetical protein
VNLYAEYPKISTWSHLQRVSQPVMSPQRWTSLQANKTTLEPLKPPSLKGAQSPTAAEGAPTSPNHAASSHDATSNFPRPEPAPSLMNSGLLVGRVRAKAHSCLSLENNRVNIRMLQSPYAVIWILSRSDFTSADM